MFLFPDPVVGGITDLEIFICHACGVAQHKGTIHCLKQKELSLPTQHDINPSLIRSPPMPN
jgi:hypothetical protein